MIRSTLYQLATNDRLAVQVGASIAKPAAAVLAPRLWRALSTKPQHHDDELLQKTFSDAFDESDSIEVGKDVITKEETKEKSRPVHPLYRHRSLFDGPIFRPLFRSGFDDLFRDPFAPFFSRSQDPFMDIMPVLRKELGPRTTLLRASPGYEIREVDNAYEIEVRIPEGLESADNLKIEVDDNVVHVSGAREDENRKMRFDKLFTIGDNVDADQIAATLDGNVLKVTAPKLQVDTKRTVPIMTAGEEDHRATEAEVTQHAAVDDAKKDDFTETGKQELEDWNKEK